MPNRIELDGDKVFRQWCSEHRLSPKVDADGTLIVPGKLGHLFYDMIDDRSWLVYVVFQPPQPMKGWKNRREALIAAGADIWQSGDMEGIARFHPNNKRALRVACRSVGIRQRRELSPAEREETLRRLQLAREAKQHART